MEQYIIDCGDIITSDIFIIPCLGTVYIRLLTEKQYALRRPGNIVEHTLRQSDLYLGWSFITHQRHYVDVDTFRTQFNVFKCLKEMDKDFQDDLVEAILDNDLSSLAFKSEHLF